MHNYFHHFCYLHSLTASTDNITISFTVFFHSTWLINCTHALHSFIYTGSVHSFIYIHSFTMVLITHIHVHSFITLFHVHSFITLIHLHPFSTLIHLHSFITFIHLRLFNPFVHLHSFSDIRSFTLIYLLSFVYTHSLHIFISIITHIH